MPSFTSIQKPHRRLCCAEMRVPRASYTDSEDDSTQGHWFTDGELQFFGSVHREKVADVCTVLFDWYNANKQADEKMGAFIHCQGFAAVLATFKGDEGTAELLEKRNPKVGFDPYVYGDLVAK